MGTSVLSSNASFIVIIFCRCEVPDWPFFEGGPSGGNGDVDKDKPVGLVIADELEEPPFFELWPELIDEGLEREFESEPALDFGCWTRCTCRGLPFISLATGLVELSVLVKVRVKNLSSSVSQIVIIIFADTWRKLTSFFLDVTAFKLPCWMMTSMTESCTTD